MSEQLLPSHMTKKPSIKVYEFDSNGIVIMELLAEPSMELSYNMTSEPKPHYLRYAKVDPATKGWVPDMEAYRKEKKDELNIKCDETIILGSTFILDEVEYRFSYDRDAQQNYSDAEAAFSSDAVPNGLVPWTAHRVDTGERCRVQLSKEQLRGLRLKQIAHKNQVITYYNELLLNQVFTAQTPEELELVEWLYTS